MSLHLCELFYVLACQSTLEILKMLYEQRYYYHVELQLAVW